MKIVLVTGGFDPLHSGHISYFEAAKKLGDKLVVGINSDAWLQRKKGRSFMPWYERASIIKSIGCVDEVIEFNDDDGSATDAINQTRKLYPKTEIIFANGGDRQADNIPELFDDNTGELTFVYGVGGEDKKNSSSWILKEWSQPTTERAWGTYTILDKGDGWQVKQLAFDAGKALSDQRHFKRSEHWHVVEGKIEMVLESPTGANVTKECMSGDSVDIPVKYWHKATNIGNIPAKVIEVWLGDELTEEDIERRD